MRSVVRTPQKFLTHHNLQGSQTTTDELPKVLEFLTHHNLQGSQTHLLY